MQRQVILNALITIWDSEQEAPISCHPERNNITLAKRKRDWDQIEQCLMPEYSHADVIKNDFGQPSLLDGKFLSISHSDRFAATAISIEPVGIDIQVPRTTIFKVRHKYMESGVQKSKWFSFVYDANYHKEISESILTKNIQSVYGVVFFCSKALKHLMVNTEDYLKAQEVIMEREQEILRMIQEGTLLTSGDGMQ